MGSSAWSFSSISKGPSHRQRPIALAELIPAAILREIVGRTDPQRHHPQPMSRNNVKSARRTRPASQIITGVTPIDRTPAQVRARFRALLADGARLRPVGEARHDPDTLLHGHYLPRHELQLFDATLFLTGLMYNEALGFCIGYVVLGERSRARALTIHPRLFYKDSSLMWRAASHFIHDTEEYWIGKGDVRLEQDGGKEYVTSAEETTNLPLELQFAMDELSRRQRRRHDDGVIELVVRAAPSGRIEPYTDFSKPRRATAARHAINGDRPIARFRKSGDPGSLVFTRGFEPDFAHGVIEEHTSESKFFGGSLRKIRILSTNGAIQYLFFASPTHAWVTHPQALSTELSSYAVRTLDVFAPDDLSIPGYEYHEDENDSQIPAGYAGAPHPKDPHRSDASAWLEQLPVIREFRSKVLRRR
jgi:hypothetical protein